MVTPCINNTEPFLLPTDAHNVKKRKLLKHSKSHSARYTRLTGHNYAAIALTTLCTSFTQILLTKRVIFSQALTLAP